MKITCELDWLDEEESVDEAITNKIVDQVAELVSKRMSKDLFEKVERDASERMAKEVDALTERLIERFMEKEITVTDAWGDVKEKHENVTELLKHKFDWFLTQRVDEKGHTQSGCSYGKTYKRIDYLLDQRIAEHSKILTAEIAAQVEAKINAKKAEIHKNTIAQIAKKMGLEV